MGNKPGPKPKDDKKTLTLKLKKTAPKEGAHAPQPTSSMGKATASGGAANAAPELDMHELEARRKEIFDNLKKCELQVRCGASPAAFFHVRRAAVIQWA